MSAKSANKAKVLFATTELTPYVTTGGLGAVAAGLPPALAKKGLDIRYLLPGYPAIRSQLKRAKMLHGFDDLYGQPAQLWLGTLPNGLKAYVLECDAYFDRANPYTDTNGENWGDNHLRFAAFAFVAANLARFDTGWQPDLIHGNDWHCGLIPAYIRSAKTSIPTVLTVHNMAFQGLFPQHMLASTGLPEEMFSIEGLEYHGQIGYLKSGLYYADAITTVSPAYAEEIRTTEYGCGLQGLLNDRKVTTHGIINGIDHAVWNPETDTALAAPYTARSLTGKKKNKAALLQECSLQPGANPFVLGVVTRMTHQKGLDLLAEALPAFLTHDTRMIVLGSGDAALEQRYRDLASQYPGQMAVIIGYDEDLSHRILAGADAIAMPSRFEPCGLVQLSAQRYGTLPIVRRTGGLSDTVEDGDTGFVFEAASADDLRDCLFRAMATYADPKNWKRMQQKAMALDWSWEASAGKYLSLYRNVIGSRDNLDRLVEEAA